MAQIAFIHVSEKDELIGFYLVEDVAVLEGLGKLYSFEEAPKSQSLDCIPPIRKCVNSPNCCCFYLGGGREINVNCQN